MLAARTRGAVGLHAQFLLVDLQGDITLDERRHINRSERGMAATRRVERGDADEPVDASLRGQQAVGVLAVHRECRALETRLVALGGLVQFGGEAPVLGPAEVHAKQHLRPVLALRTACPGVDADDGVAGVELSGKEPLLFQTLDRSGDVGYQALDLVNGIGGQVFALGLLGGDLQQQLEIVHLRDEPLIHIQPASNATVPGAYALGLGLVVPEIGCAHLHFQLGDAASKFSGVKDSPLPTAACHGIPRRAPDTRQGTSFASLSSQPCVAQV